MVGANGGGGVRRVVLTAMMSLDGQFDGPGDGFERIDWFRADGEWSDYSVELLDGAGTLVFGRRTFEGMAAYWPSQTDAVAQRMNGLEKIGFSRTPRSTDWANARFATDPAGEIERVKRSGGEGDVVVMGSADLAATLTEHRLIDEYRLAVNPVVLGAGSPLFRPGTPRLDLQRSDVRLFRSGIVEIRLQPANQTRTEDRA